VINNISLYLPLVWKEMHYMILWKHLGFKVDISVGTWNYWYWSKIGRKILLCNSIYIILPVYATVELGGEVACVIIIYFYLIKCPPYKFVYNTYTIMNPHVGNGNCIIICSVIYVLRCVHEWYSVRLGEALTSHIVEEFYDFHRTDDVTVVVLRIIKIKWRIIDYSCYVFPWPMNL